MYVICKILPYVWRGINIFIYQFVINWLSKGFFCFVLLLIWCLATYTRLASNSWSFCLHLPSARIIGSCYHTQLEITSYPVADLQTLFFFFFAVLGFDSGFCTSSNLLLEPCSQAFLFICLFVYLFIRFSLFLNRVLSFCPGCSQIEIFLSVPPM
jgi:hypothetical protein